MNYFMHTSYNNRVAQNIEIINEHTDVLFLSIFALRKFYFTLMFAFFCYP